MLQWILDGAMRGVLEAAIYAAIALVLVGAMLRCFVPVRRNMRALRRAARDLVGDAKLQRSRPTWNEVDFLGKGLRTEWARFLQNAELMDAHGEPCEVEDYINEDTAIYNAANSQLADLTPGVLVSVGILGTFLGLVLALSGVNLNDISLITETIQSMIGGMFVAFLTSVCGIIASLIFTYSNRYVLGRAHRALDHFLKNFRQYAMPMPADTGNKMVALQREQNEYMRTFVEEVSLRTATQIEQAIMRALLPVQRSMDNFIVAATREQVEGMDKVAARFVERMNLVLDGQLSKLGDTLAQLNASHQHTQSDLQAAAAVISSVTQDVAQMQRHVQNMFGQMDGFFERVEQAGSSAAIAGARSAELLETIHTTSMQQAKYLTKLQDYQAELQGSVQQYIQWADKLLSTTDEQSRNTNEGLARIATDLQDSASLLQSSYDSFVENIQIGLARALGMFDENITAIAKDLNAAMQGIHTVVKEVPAMMAGSARKYGTQVDQFVDALSQLQKGMQSVTVALEKREVG
ncbi:MAG: MotA/TolQ/ExbB proton channel family protein [Clostridia bacterium]|nr:MotA/TolQ/ExbB proton channel family protein [Clostridia bacterium]